ncbi:TPA: SPI-4 type I secretion system protein SiiF [Salmonella enterica subsp. enterica serovar Dublin]|nr:SPI-4 type I secretion system protein SiiF [Salmonella enterica subsp. enterica serovar Dublin]HDP0790711.1 SPI-4 type I secretion system protein SiiF [Salmonella enterica subsp. enterica serovar Dublin]HDP0823038.1 SPI-4 type I secretion system protein SiiF [Salmonella enterica subsp. enterica serovar Dublin]
MDKKLEPYYLSAETALSIVSKKFNIKIDIKEDDINLRFKKYDRNNTDDSIQMKNFFLSLGLSLQDILFNNGEDLLNEPMPILLLTPEMKWMVCVSGGQKIKLVNARGELCYVEIEDEYLKELSAFSILLLNKVVDSIRVKNIIKNSLSMNKIFYTKYFFSSLFMAIFALTIPVFSNLFYDKLVPSASVSSLFGVAIIVAVFIVFEFILRTSKDIYQSITARQDDVDIDIAFLEAVLYSKKKNGRSMSSAFVLWNEFQKIKPVLLNSIFQRIADIPIFIIFLIVIYVNLGLVVIVPITMFIVSIIISLVNHHYTNELMNKQKEGQKNRNIFISEVFLSIKMIHTLNNQGLLFDWVNTSNEQSYLNLKIRKLNLIYQSILGSMSSITQITIMVIAFFMVIKGDVTTGAIVSSVIVSGRISGIISNFSSTLISILSAEKTGKDLLSFFDEDQAEKTPALQSISKCNGDISIRGVSYQYDAQSPMIINRLSIDIPAGQRVAVVGECGAGKSSLLGMLSGYLSPTDGAILYDGYNLGHLSQNFFSQHLSVVTTHDVLFTGTIESNFALKPQNDRGRVLKALQLANCGFILQHPMGLKFPVNFMAKNLSSGQQQQLLLARSLSSDASVFLWDEPTSNLDENTEKQIFDNLDEFIHGKTLIMVTHRRYLIKYFDRVLVMKGGKIIRDCSPDKLLM